MFRGVLNGDEARAARMNGGVLQYNVRISARQIRTARRRNVRTLLGLDLVRVVLVLSRASTLQIGLRRLDRQIRRSSTSACNAARDSVLVERFVSNCLQDQMGEDAVFASGVSVREI